MSRMLTVLLFVFALSGGAVAQNPFAGTHDTVAPLGTLDIKYSGGSELITITDATEEVVGHVQIEDGEATFQVPEGAEELLVLSDPFGNDYTVRIVEN